MKVGETVTYVGRDNHGDRLYQGSRGIVTGLTDFHDEPSAHVAWVTNHRPPPPPTSYLRNLERIDMIDTNKRLHLLTRGTDPVEVKLLGKDNFGNLIVDITNAKKDSHWMVFDPNGVFVRSNNGGGRALSLINAPERVTHRFTIVMTGNTPYFSPTEAGAHCDIQIETEGNFVVSVTKRADLS